jgi:hypothetical protein
MTTFDERERIEETRFQRDEETRFRVRNRRNKLFGLWVAREQLKLPETEQSEYAQSVVLADFEQPGDADVIRKVQGDLTAKSISISDHMLERRLHEFEATARAQVVSE